MIRLSGMVVTVVLVSAFAATVSLLAQSSAGFPGGITAQQSAVQSRPAAASGSGLVGNPVAPFVNAPVSGARPNQLPASRPLPSNPLVPTPRTVIVAPGFGFGFGAHSPFLYPDPYYPYVSPYSHQYPYTDPAYVTPPPVDQSQGQAIEALRQQQALQAQQQVIQPEPPPTPQAVRSVPPPAPVAPSVPVVLIFRDGHRLEVQNYAITGQTMWVFDEGNSSKIPLADLDLEATQRENRGVRFSLPSA